LNWPLGRDISQIAEVTKARRSNTNDQLKYRPENSVWPAQTGPLANPVPVSLDELADTVRFALRRIQYRPDLIDGCLAETGLVVRRA
jgi:hypothetical protein